MRLKHLFLFLAVLALPSTNSIGAVVVLDDFSIGNFSLHRGEEAFTDLGVTNRRVGGVGFVPWTADLVLGSGEMTYHIIQSRDFPNGTDWLQLDYYVGALVPSGDPLAVLGIDGFVIRISGLVGTGSLAVDLNDLLVGTVELPISGTGDIYYPLANIAGVAGDGDVNLLQFRFITTSKDFSITIDQITLVPEPSSGLCFVVGAVCCLARRRRGK